MRVGNLTRPYRCVLPHTNTPTVPKVSSLQCRRQIIPVHCLALRNRYGSTQIHHGSKRGETDGSCRRHQDSPVYRRLVNESKNKTAMSREYTQVDSSCAELGLDHKFRKITFNSNSRNQIFGLQIRPQGRSSLSNSKENRSSSGKNSFHVGISSNISKEAHVTNWKHGFNGEDNTIGSSAYEATSMVSEDTLEVSSVSGYPSTCVPGSQTASSVVDQSFKFEEGFPTSSEGVQSPSIHRCFPKRLGGSFRASHSQWSVESGGVKTSHKHSRTKSSVSSFKIIRKSASESKSADVHRQLFSGCLSKQTGRHPFSRNVCLIWRIMAWTNARGIQIRAEHILGNLNVLADSLSRKDKVIQTEWALNHRMFNQICHCWHQPMVDLFATKLNHKLSMYVSPVPDGRAWETDALNISWEGLDAYVFCAVALIPQVIQKMTTYRCRIIMIAPGWPGMSWFWDLVDLSTRLPLRLPLWVDLLTQTFSNRLHNNLTYLNLHAWHLESVLKVQEDSQRRWRSELRSLSDTPRGESMNQGGPYLGSGVRRVRWTSQIPLFQT